MIDQEFRRYLTELYRQDDRARAEHRAWKAEREAQAAAQEREIEEEAVEYRTADNDAPEPAPAAEPEPFYEQASTAPNFFDDIERNEEFADTLAYVFAKLQDQWRDEIADETRRLSYLIERMAYPGERGERLAYELQSRLLDVEARVRQFGGEHVERRLADLAAENSELKAMLGDLMRRTAKGTAVDREIIDLPGNFVRHTSIDANGKITLIRRRDAAA
jgi:hypothetical protein